MSTFTIKYRMTDGAEHLDGGFTQIGSNIGEFLPRPDLPHDHPDNNEKVYRRCVTGYKDGGSVTFGPIIMPSDQGLPAHSPIAIPRVWVMNEQGATVAQYDLL